MADSNDEISKGNAMHTTFFLPALSTLALSTKNENSRTRPVVYVVDYDASSRESLGSLFRSLGLAVELFGSAQNFLTAYVPNGPCCLVLGVRLSEPSGLDFQAELVKANIQIPIIFTSDEGDIPTSVRAIKAGAVDFLTKPFRDEEMLDAIHVALERDRVRQEREKTVADVRDKFETLTKREQEVMALVTTGLLNRQIAAEIGMTVGAVKILRGKVTRKMGAKSLANLVRMADVLKVVSPRRSGSLGEDIGTPPPGGGTWTPPAIVRLN